MVHCIESAVKALFVSIVNSDKTEMNVVSRGARLLRSFPQLHWYHDRSTYYESVINIDMSTRRAARISERESKYSE